MKQTNKRFLGIAAGSVLVIGVATGVFAHGYGPGWGGHQGMMGGPDAMHGRFGGPGWMRGGDSAVGSDQRLAELKTTLGITPEQESAWSAYTEALKGKAEVIASHRQVMHGPTPVSADQRLNFHQQGLEQMQRLNTATRNLYAVLSPEQKARAGGLVSTPCVAR